MRKYLRGVPRVLGASLAASLLKKDRAQTAGGISSSSSALPGQLTVTQAAVDGIAVKSLLATEATRGVRALATRAEKLHQGEARDLVVRAEGDNRGHLRKRVGAHLVAVTACGKFVNRELSHQESRNFDISDLCQECTALRDFDAWISENIEMNE